MKSFLVVLIVLCSVSLFAQSPVGKGVYSLGGSVSYSNFSYENGNDDRSNFTFAPRFDYFFIDNFSAGINIEYTSISIGGNSADSWGLGPAFRYYFNTGDIKPFLGIAYLYTSRDYSIGGSADDDRAYGNTFAFSGGLDYFLARNVALEASVNYKIMNYSYDDENIYVYDDYTINEINIAIGINVFIF